MMKEEALERQSTLYLVQLEHWQLLRWRRRLELLNESTDDLWLIRKVLKDKIDKRKLNAEYGIFAKALKLPVEGEAGVTTRDVRKHTGTYTK